MMRMSCPSFLDNVFRLAVGGRVFNGRLHVMHAIDDVDVSRT